MRTATLTLLTLLGLVAGSYYGQLVLFDPQSPIDTKHWTFVAGDLLLIRPLVLLTPPLTVACIVVAGGRTKAASRFGLALGATLAWFAIMMIVSVSLGAAAATLLRAGDIAPEARGALIGASAARFESTPEVAQGVQAIINNHQNTLAGASLAIVRRVLPDNLISDLGAGRLLGLIVLALLIGLGLASIGERGSAALVVIEALQAALLRAARWISWIAPLGIFLLVANAVGSVGLEGVRGTMERFCLTVVVAFGAHAIILLPLALLIFGRCNPIAYAWRAMRALGVALGSASSIVALPVALDSVIDDPGSPSRRNGRPSRSACSKAAASLVLPLGASLNLNGTAIFQAAAVVFLCQAHGVALETSDLVVIAITAAIAALSTAGVPAAGLGTLIIVITAVNTSLAGRGVEPLPASAIGMLIAVDRVLDMCRTAVNVWGNLVGARVISAIAPDEMGVTNDELRMANAGAASRPI